MKKSIKGNKGELENNTKLTDEKVIAIFILGSIDASGVFLDVKISVNSPNFILVHSFPDHETRGIIGGSKTQR